MFKGFTEKQMTTPNWYGFELPNRPTKHTYAFWSSKPIVKPYARYKQITTLDALHQYVKELKNKRERTPLLQSPTDAVFVNHGRTFYTDSQDLISWYYDSGAVYSDDNTRVADSLPEFLTRIEIENSIWYKTNVWNAPLSYAEEEYVKAL